MRHLGVALLIMVLAGCKDNSKEQQPQPVPEERSPQQKESIARGAEIYNNFCASCHLSGGEGIKGVFPPLKDSDWLRENRKESIRAVKLGIRGPIEVNGVEYDNLMPSLGLTNEETADVLNYVFTAWGNQIGPTVSPEEVSALTE